MAKRLTMSIIHGGRIYTPESDNVPEAVFQREAELNGDVQEDAPAASTQSADNVPFEGYDDLTANEIAEQLESMDEAEREAVRTYESANKKRKTVLEAL